MTRNQLDQLHAFFHAFTARHFNNDAFVNANLQRKVAHSWRVAGETRWLVNRLRLDEEQANLARGIAILHDTGRFPQFVRYKTYADIRSINHGVLGAEILEAEDVLNAITAREREIILTAVRHHGDRLLPETLDKDKRFFTMLVRDADKLDIYRVVIEAARMYQQDPAAFPYEVEFPNTPGYSPAVFSALETRGKIDYRVLRNLNDSTLLQIAWVFDMNFAPTFRRVQHYGFIEELFSYLPDDDNIRRARRQVLDYITYAGAKRPEIS
ncbi:MAG: HD domain-containing protein [Sedimentisphaerales bacterium]|nr:HD domain-containing protein [Sedimentisphaerales bacterium]